MQWDKCPVHSDTAEMQQWSVEGTVSERPYREDSISPLAISICRFPIACETV
jgi:hypothetical protein